MKAMRRPHKKSRLGCQACKKRKVKCDEVKPQCGNCIRFELPCDFSPIPPQPVQASATGSGRRPARRGRPRSDWASWAEQIRLSSTTGDAQSREGAIQPLNVEDLELFFHYLHVAAGTIGDDAKLWSEGVPQLGFQYPFVLELVLALSAYHLAKRHTNPARYLELAEHHSTLGLRAATESLKDLTSEKSPALYISAVLICFTALAKGPCPGHFLLFAENEQISWLPLLWGVRLVVSTMGWSSIFSGPLAPYRPEPKESREEESAADVSPEPLDPGNEDWRASLNGISDLINSESQQYKDHYKREIELLGGCFESIFGKGKNASQGITGEMQVVMGWVYQLDDVFVERLGQKDPIAFIILGHFCPLLKTTERYWFVEGWAQHIINEILRVSPVYRKWLSWPLQYIEGNNSTSVGALPVPFEPNTVPL